MAWDRQITLKSAAELEIMRQAGLINAQALATLSAEERSRTVVMLLSLDPDRTVMIGDRARDLLNNRTKRLFDDPVGKRVGAHELPALLQTYRRDTGEIMHDLSVPIYVRGRHWGGFRVGYPPQQTENQATYAAVSLF